MSFLRLINQYLYDLLSQAFKWDRFLINIFLLCFQKAKVMKYEKSTIFDVQEL